MRKHILATSAMALIGALGAAASGPVVVAGEGPGLSQQTARQIADQGVKPTKGDKRSSDMRGLLGHQ